MNLPLPLASPEGRAELGRLRTAKTLYAFDYDGTLAPFVQDPAEAFMAPEMAEAFRALMEKRPVAVITGRSLAAITRLLPVRPLFLVGNHGVEGVAWERATLERCASAVRVWRPELAARLAHRKDIRLEDKGYSMTAHFRGSPDGEAARRAVLEAVEALTPKPRPIGGLDVVNLVPPEAPHKGAALARLVRDNGFERAVFVGDDVTDEDVFEHAGPEVTTIRVACRPAPTAARFYTTLPAMAGWLRAMV